MKSKRAEEFINNRSEVVDGQWRMVDASTARRAVELAEQDAEEQYQDDLHHYQLMMNDTCSEMIDERDEEITRYRKELEESKRREELARKVIDDQRKKIKALKARAAEAFKEYMEQAHGGYLTSDLDNFIQKTQRAMKLAVIIGASWPELIIQVSDTKEILSCDPFVGCALSIPEDVNTVEGYKKYIASRLVGREIIINLDCLRYDGVLLPQENDLKLIEV